MRAELLAIGIVMALCGGCSSSEGSKDGAESSGKAPASAAADKSESPSVRAQGVRAVWAAAQGKGDAAMAEAREEMKKVIWKGGAPQAMREAAIECLLSDTRPDALADTANMFRLRLPTEPNFGVLKFTCEAIVARGADPVWHRSVTGLVRSWARKLPSPVDDERPERAAIAAMYPERSVEDTVFAVFVDPVAYGAQADSTEGTKNNDVLGSGLAPDSARRIRQSAWDLLGRIDRQGVRRTSLLAGGVPTGGDETLDALVQTARDLRVVPLTGSELAWVEGIRNSKDPKDAAWWSGVSSLAGSLSEAQRAGLQLRHLEPLRWAGANHPEWLTMDQRALMDTLGSRLKARRTYRVGQSEGVDFAKNRNRIQDWPDAFVWGDAITMLVIDESVQSPSVILEIFRQSIADQADSSTEWGGCLFDASQRGGSAGGESGVGFVAVSYSARPAQRINDRTFVASEDMFSRGGRSLAHYHFHAQSQSNQAYAGPGAGDADYADLHNRNCVVFTPVRAGVINVDYYQRDGATVDLGEIHETK